MKFLGNQISDYQEWKRIHEIGKSYFAIPGVFRCSPERVQEVKQNFDNSLLETQLKYSEGELSLEQFCDALKNKVEPLRKVYHFYKARCSLPGLV